MEKGKRKRWSEAVMVGSQERKERGK